MEAGVIEELFAFGVGGEVDLEAAVEQEAVDRIGADAAARGVGGFKELEGDVAALEFESATEAGQTRANNGDRMRIHVISRRRPTLRRTRNSLILSRVRRPMRRSSERMRARKSFCARRAK